MKTILNRSWNLILAGMLIIPSYGFTQEEEQPLEIVKSNVERIKQEIDAVTKPSEKVSMGLYLSDLDFEQVYEMHYPHNYGVKVRGVTKDGNAGRAGIIKGDVILEFDGSKVRFENHLLRLRNAKKVGESADLKIWRDENTFTTQLQFDPAPMGIAKTSKPKKTRLSPGYGGGGPEAIYIEFDFTGINNLLALNGFNKVTDGYTVAYGGGGHGNVGKGWFIGGMGAGLDKQQQLPVKDENGNTTGHKKYKFSTGFGGVTLTKKVPFMTERIVLDFGIMLGGGETSIAMHQTTGDYSWSDLINGNNNHTLEYKKAYFVYRPSLGALVRIKNWVGLHGSVGYFGSYSANDQWTDANFDFSVTGDSPNTPNGLSGSIGFWFGF